MNKLKDTFDFKPVGLKERIFLYRAEKEAIKNKYCNVCDHYIFDETQAIGLVGCAYRGDCKLGHTPNVLLDGKLHSCRDWVISK